MRAHLIVADEFRMIDKVIIDSVLRKFKASPRQPPYLNNEKYKNLVERNKEIYLSSAWLCNHWSWAKFKAFFAKMVKGGNYFVCGLPYQLAIKEGLLMRDQVLDEMSEDDFDPLDWSINSFCAPNIVICC